MICGVSLRQEIPPQFGCWIAAVFPLSFFVTMTLVVFLGSFKPPLIRFWEHMEITQDDKWAKILWGSWEKRKLLRLGTQTTGVIYFNVSKWICSFVSLSRWLSVESAESAVLLHQLVILSVFVAEQQISYNRKTSMWETPGRVDVLCWLELGFFAWWGLGDWREKKNGGVVCYCWFYWFLGVPYATSSENLEVT